MHTGSIGRGALLLLLLLLLRTRSIRGTSGSRRNCRRRCARDATRSASSRTRGAFISFDCILTTAYHTAFLAALLVQVHIAQPGTISCFVRTIELGAVAIAAWWAACGWCTVGMHHCDAPVPAAAPVAVPLTVLTRPASFGLFFGDLQSLACNWFRL